MVLVQDTNTEGMDDRVRASQIFRASYRLLARWQLNLEFYLFGFCQIKSPQIIAQCHWPCAEAAELTRLSEKITEYCSHDMTDFEKFGISVDERDHFCAELHKIRQLRNTAVHREPVNTVTIRRFARNALSVLKFVRLLGGKGFEEAYGESLDGLFEDLQAVVSSSDRQCTQDLIERLSGKTTEQISAEKRRTKNMAKMIQEFQAAQCRRDLNQHLAVQQSEVAEERKAERARRANDQENAAKQKIIKKAFNMKQETAEGHTDAEGHNDGATGDNHPTDRFRG